MSVQNKVVHVTKTVQQCMMVWRSISNPLIRRVSKRLANLIFFGYYFDSIMLAPKSRVFGCFFDVFVGLVLLFFGFVYRARLILLSTFLKGHRQKVGHETNYPIKFGERSQIQTTAM